MLKLFEAPGYEWRTRRRHCLSAVLLLASLPAMGADSQPSGTGGRLAGGYFSEDNSKLVLEYDGTFGWKLTQGDQGRYVKGRWEFANERVRLLADKPSEAKTLFEVAATRAWDDDAAKRLSASERQQVKLRGYETCPFLKTYEQAGFTLAMNSSLARADTRGEPGPQGQDVAQLNRHAANVGAAKRTAEQAIAAATGALAEDRGATNFRAAHNARMVAADRAVGDYWHRYAAASQAYIAAGRPSDGLPLLQFDSTPCIDQDRGADAVEADVGYAVIVGETIPGEWWQTLPMRVEFIFADGSREQRDLEEDGWALYRVVLRLTCGRSDCIHSIKTSLRLFWMFPRIRLSFSRFAWIPAQCCNHPWRK